MPGAQGRPAASRRLAAGGFSRRRIRLWQVALAVLAGNLLLHQLPVLPGAVWLTVCVLVAIAVGRHQLLATAFLLAFAWTATVAQSGLAARWTPETDGQDVVLSGWIDGLPQREAGRTVFPLRIVAADTEVPLRRVRLSWYEPMPDLAAGQPLTVEARLRSPRGLVNPGGFDYERWLFLERFDATGYVRNGLADSRRRTTLGQRWLRLRAGLADRLGRLIDDADAAALIQALALGERGSFEDRHWTVLQRTGTSHLVAVSGLHIGMIAGLSFLLSLKLALRMPYAVACRSWSLAAVSSAATAAVYAALAGFTLPTRRALIMLLAVQALVIARRSWPLGSGLGLAMVLILALDPLASLTASFWLSFGAVALVAAGTAKIERPFERRRPRWFENALGFGRLQLVLTFGLAPLVVWYFGQFSIVSLLVNLIAIPVFALLVVPLALLTALVALAGSEMTALSWLTGIIAEQVWRLLEFAASGRLAAFELPRPPLPVFLLAVASIAFGVAPHRMPGRRLALLGLVPLAVDHGNAVRPGFARATILDVGHGLSIAIETAGHRLLYDAGPLYRSGFDAGIEIVVPALAAIGSDPLDRLIVSHGDSDHAGGAAAIIARYPDVAVLKGPDVDQLPGAVCYAGQSWSFDQVEFRVLHPPMDMALTGNDSSCVIAMETHSGRLLLTGDIETRAEGLLLGEQQLRSDVVVVPHHGSLTSSTVTFVDAVGARLAIVSAGHNNRWNFPRHEVRDRWTDMGARLLVTGDTGAVTVDFRPEGIAVSAMREARRRYWQAKQEPDSGDFELSAL